MNIVKKTLYVVSLFASCHLAASDHQDIERGPASYLQDDAIEMQENTRTSGYAQVSQDEASQAQVGCGSMCAVVPTCPDMHAPECMSSACSSSVQSCQQSFIDCGNATSAFAAQCAAGSREQCSGMSEGATRNMHDNYYHAGNLTGKTLILYYKGVGPNYCSAKSCSSQQSCKTDAHGHRSCSTTRSCTSHQVDCIKTLYSQDRTTIRNFGHLTKLCGRYYKSNSGWEVGSTECVTTKGLKSFDWVLHDHRSRIVFTREAEYYNTTGTAYQYSLDEETSTRMDAEKRCAEEYIHVELNEQNEPILTRRNCYDSVTSAQADKQARDIRLHDSLTSQNLRDKA